MTCTNCGKTLPEGAVFCDGCGAKQTAPVAPAAPVVETPVAPAAPVAPEAPAAPTAAPAPVIINNTVPAKRVVSPAGYIGRSLIACIPIVGWLIYFIMLFVWAGNDSVEDSFRNWAKAQLWLLLIYAILLVIVALIVWFIFFQSMVIISA